MLLKKNKTKQLLFAWFVLTNTFFCITVSINVNNLFMLNSAIPWIIEISLAAITNYLLAKSLIINWILLPSRRVTSVRC
ncbi:hypothetical protein DMS22_21205 [Klebsiella variicola]|nr:hypothetical protein DMS22_21205 [Klebsiella variicola]